MSHFRVQGEGQSPKSATRHPSITVNPNGRARWIDGCFCLVLGCAAIVMAWLVLTGSLPFALATYTPERALMLSPNNPAALIAQIERQRATLLQSSNLTTTERVEIRAEIRASARKIIKVAPLNAKVFRFLGEMAADRRQARAFMREAVARSRRETLALLWLFKDSLERSDYHTALGHADILLRTKPQLETLVFDHLTRILDAPSSFVTLAKKLAENPNWRSRFLVALPNRIAHPQVQLALFVELQKSHHPATIEEKRPFLDALLARSGARSSYGVWLQLLAVDEQSTVGLINNASFDLVPTGLPFDWRVSRQQNAIAEFIEDGASGRSLRIQFTGARAIVPAVSQIILLPPGRYQIGGRTRGQIRAKRGMRWQLHCLGAQQTIIGQTDMLYGNGSRWRRFRFEGEVPNDPNCRAQVLRLFHHARSASEQLIAGDIWFDDLHIDVLR